MRIAALTLAVSATMVLRAEAQQWPVHSLERPKPPVVNPGPAGPPAPVPSDAIVLFDGRSLDAWETADSLALPPRWKVTGSFMEVAAGTGGIRTRKSFGDVQLRVEWASPTPPRGEGQDRGNSGVFLMGRYEVQVLDSYRSDTYADGQASALYGQYPPLVNASRAPGEWQSYDIVFHRPHFNADGSLQSPARVTVFHNGVLVHDNVALKGATAHAREATYVAHEDRVPIMLQDHGHPVRFRNIWVRELE